MKKKLFLLLVAPFITFMIACRSENSEPVPTNGNGIIEELESIKSIFTGTIEEISSETSALIVVDSGKILRSSDKVTINLTKALEDATFEVGDKIKVSYDGEVRESYPAQINKISVEKNK